MRARDTAAATRLAQQALAAGYSHPLLFHLRARARMQEGQPSPALADLQNALMLAPQSAELLADAACCLNAMAEYPRAAVLAGEAVALGPHLAPAWYQKGYAHQMLVELDAAIAAFAQAVRCDPFSVDAHARLAHIASDQRRLEDARAHAAKALAIDPRNGIARLARAAADAADGWLNAAQADLQAVLADDALLPEIRAVAQSRLAEVHDALGRYDAAFDDCIRAGKLWKSCYAPRVLKPGQETGLGRLERLTRTLEAQPAHAWA